MLAGLLIVFFPCAILLIAGAATAGIAVRALRGGSGSRPAALLRLVSGAGTLAFAVLAVSPMWTEVQYGIVFVPIAAVILAAIWNAVLLGSAALVEWFARRRSA